MAIMDGVSLRNSLLEKYTKIIKSENLSIRLDIITVGDDPASEIYVRNKIKYANLCGIKVVHHKLESSITEEKLNCLIDELNTDEEVTGIILQSPVPKHLVFDKLAGRIAYYKDIDGFTKENIYSLYQNREYLIPCTVKGIMTLFNHYRITLKGKKVTIIGRGQIVGRPLALALSNADATVSLCHSKTENLKDYTKDADIVISAVGKSHLVTEDMVKDGFIGIDVGISRIDGKISGDFDYENVEEKAKFITPVPGGVGPMTIAMIIDNLIFAKKNYSKLKEEKK